LDLKKLQGKKRLKVLGLMSGTSANGIDACIAEIEKKGSGIKIRQIGFKTFEFPSSLRNEILKVSDPGYQNIDHIIRLDFLLGEYFAKAAKKMAQICGLDIRNINLIGSHGQTVRHLPQLKELHGFPVRGTLQIGEPQVISNRTGVITIADFRRKEIAEGREGAPLTPLAHFYLFNNEEKTQGILNIGGIANLTFLPKGKGIEKVWGMDAGPGNMFIDNLMRKFFKKNYDKDGRTAFKGKMVEPVMELFQKKIFVLLKKRKSIGREDFDKKFTQEFVRKTLEYTKRPEDLVKTASELTIRSVYQAYENFLKSDEQLEELILCGGGALNRYIFKRLKELFNPAEVYVSNDLGYNQCSVESLSFAIFAFLTYSQLSGDSSPLIDISQSTISGKICLP
jgi:anhydro-N-acetylmuramic acid kinase